MSYTIEGGKETGLIQIGVVPKPLVLCQISAINPATQMVDSGSDTVYLCTTPAIGGDTLVYGGNTYLALLQDNLIDAIQELSAQGYDIPGSITLKIADGNFSIWTNHANLFGWRGGNLTVTFVLYDLPSNSYSTNAYVWTFILDKPNVDATGLLTVAGQARQSMTRLSVPNFARQNRCGWIAQFPATAAQRAAALNDPTAPGYGCGYSPDISGGVGNTTTANLTNADGSPLTDAAGIYVMCDGTRSCGSRSGTLTQGCMARLGNYSGNPAGAGVTVVDGDITRDTSGRATARFTGDTWNAPTGWAGKQYTNPGAGKQYGFNAPNPPTGTTYYNQGYGTQWVNATVLAPAGDPNSDRAECIVCMAPVSAAQILKVLVNGEEITQNHSDVLFTYYATTLGGRTGAVSLDKSYYQGTGDPHGSQCCIEVVVPAQLANPGSIMSVQVLVQFPPAMRWSGSAGFFFPPLPDTAMVDAFGAAAENPVWALMDLITMWGPFTTADITNPQAWYDAANFCAQQLSYIGINGTTQMHARYRGSLALTDDNRQTLAKAVTGIRNCAGIILSRDPVDGGLIPLIEGTLADQQPLPINGSNYNVPIPSFTAAGNATLAGGGITSSATSLTLSYAMQLVTGQVIQIDAEMLQVTGGTGTTALTATRGFNGTTAAAHSSGAIVQPCGYLAYAFDGNGSIEKDTFKLGGRSLNDTPNTVAFPFQDSANAWVQDSLTTVDQFGYVSSGNQEINTPLQILGIENFDQGTRRGNIELAKSLYGNQRFDSGGTELPSFRTGVNAAHLLGRPGLICGITYEQLSQ